LKNSEFLFFLFFLIKQPYYIGCGASNRSNRVDTTPCRFPGLNQRGDDFYHVSYLTDVISTSPGSTSVWDPSI